MNPNRKILFYLIVIFLAWNAGCTTVTTFTRIARPGDTIAIPLGWKHDLTRWNTTITITDSNSMQFVYGPGDPAVRAMIHTYPDPLSNLIVGKETGQSTYGGSYAGIASSLIEGGVTEGDKEYMETIVLLDLPAGMSEGPATIAFTDDLGNPIPNPNTDRTNIDPVSVEIIAGTGSPDSFDNQESIEITNPYLLAMERSSYNKVDLQGTTIPYAVQLNMSHDADMDNGGAGRAWIVNPRGDIKSINWSDDGFNLEVIIKPAKDAALGDMKHFKFYVAGGITGLVVNSLEAVDIDGNPVTGVTADITSIIF